MVKCSRSYSKYSYIFLFKNTLYSKTVDTIFNLTVRNFRNFLNVNKHLEIDTPSSNLVCLFEKGSTQSERHIKNCVNGF